ncbi:MAG: hypothetical protein ABIF82_00250 [Planctomycetota bacterium]
MAENHGPADLQEAVERSYRARWGGRRFCFVTAIVLLVLAVLSAVVLLAARAWFGLSPGGLRVVELAALTTSLVCLIAAVMSGLEALIRWQREKGQLPDRVIHAALCCSAVTIASLVFLFFVSTQSWEGRGIDHKLAGIIKFILFLFSGMAWLASAAMSSAGVTMLVTHRTDLLEVNDTNEGTALLFRKGHSAELVKLSIAALIPLILFVVALLMAGAYLVG